MLQEMANGIALTIFTATLAYALVDVAKATLKRLVNIPTAYPILRVVIAVYLSLIFHANLLESFGIKIFVSPFHSYVITGLVASLGAEGVYRKFGNLVAKPK